jgi:hypothetical protein
MLPFDLLLWLLLINVVLYLVFHSIALAIQQDSDTETLGDRFTNFIDTIPILLSLVIYSIMLLWERFTEKNAPNSKS